MNKKRLSGILLSLALLLGLMTGMSLTALAEGAGYTVEFAYDSLEYVLPGDTSVPLAEVLDALGLTGEAEAVAVSDASLFSASNETGAWIVTAHRAFSSTEWMKVTIGGSVYEITVTDSDNVLSGSGTEEAPYLIANTADWNTFASNINNGENANAHYKLSDNWDNSANAVTQTVGTVSRPFMGTFDGNGKTLNVSLSDTSNQGTAPFRCISDGAVIKDLTVTGSVVGTTHAAGLVGFSIGGSSVNPNTIEGCTVSASVTVNTGDNKHMGGVVGHGKGSCLKIKDTVFDGSMTCGGNYAGGLQGWSDGNHLTIENCIFTGTYSGSGDFHPIAVHNSTSETTANIDKAYYTTKPTLNENSPYIAAAGTRVYASIPAEAYEAGQVVAADGKTYFIIDYPHITIKNQTEWNEFATSVENGNDYSGRTVELAADNISVTAMVGSDDCRFKGTFDGAGKTLNVDLTATKDVCALFACLDGATIKNLTVAGTVSTSCRYGAGIAAVSFGNTAITDCVSSVSINGAVNGDGTHGGFVAVNQAGTLSFTNCVFNGRLLGSSVSHCGGFVGLANSSVSYASCLFAPAEVTMSTENSATFNRNNNSTFIPDAPSYYTVAFGDRQGGTQLCSLATGDGVTVITRPTKTIGGVNYYTANTSIELAEPGEGLAYAVNGEQIDYDRFYFTQNSTVTIGKRCSAVIMDGGIPIYDGETLLLGITADPSRAETGTPITLTVEKDATVTLDELSYRYYDNKTEEWVTAPVTANDGTYTFNMPDSFAQIQSKIRLTGRDHAIVNNLGNGPMVTVACRKNENNYYYIEATSANAGDIVHVYPNGATLTGFSVMDADNIPVEADWHDGWEPYYEFTMPDKAVTVTGEAKYPLWLGYFDTNTGSVSVKVNGAEVQWDENMPAYVEAGDTVTVTATPAGGYRLESLRWSYRQDDVPKMQMRTKRSDTDEGGNDLENGGSFTMPAAGVTIHAVFRTPWVMLRGLILNAEDGSTVTLTEDVVAPAYESSLDISSGKAITIDLAGHTIDRHLAHAKSGGYVIGVGTTATLTIKDSKGGGRITGGNNTYEGGGIYVWGTLNLEGGAITGNSAKDGGGVAIGYRNATFNLSGGEISGNANTSGRSSAGVVFNQGSMNLSGSPAVTDAVCMGDSCKLHVVGALDSSAVIAVTTDPAPTPDSPVVFTSGLHDYGNLANFVSGDDNYKLASSSSGEAQLVMETSHSVTVADTTNGTVTADRTTAAKDGTVRLTVKSNPGYKLEDLFYRVAGSTDSCPISASDSGAYRFTMPDADVTVFATFVEYRVETAYIDANGDPQTAQAIPLTGAETEELPGGWYVVSDDLQYWSELRMNGDVNLILADGGSMSFGASDDLLNLAIGQRNGTLTIYGQSAGTGALNAYSCVSIGADQLVINGGKVHAEASDWWNYAIYGQTVTINGGAVTALSMDSHTYGIYGLYSVRIKGGTVTADGNVGICANVGDVTITGGRVTAKGQEAGIITQGHTLTLGCGSGRDFIRSSSYYSGDQAGSVKIADGQTLYDEDGNAYTETLTADEVAAIAGKTLRNLVLPEFGDPDFVMPEDLTAIEESAFEGVTSLKVVDAHTCTAIGKNAFRNTGLTQIKLPEDCVINAAAFDQDGLIYVYAPSGGKTEAYCAAHDNLVFIAR